MLDLDNWSEKKYQGFIYNLDDKEYRGVEAICSSDLKKLYTDPFTYFAKIQTKQTDSMIEGTILHLLINEPHLFDDRVFVCDTSRVTKELREEAGDRYLIKKDKAEQLKACAEYIKQCLKSYHDIDLDEMDSEVSFFGEFRGRPAKCRADKLSKDKKLCIDIKKTADAGSSAFARQAMNLSYPIQSAFYQELLGVEEFIFLAIETAPLVSENGDMHFRYNLLRANEAVQQKGMQMIDMSLIALDAPEQFKTPLALDEFIENEIEFLDIKRQKIKDLNFPFWYLSAGGNNL